MRRALRSAAPRCVALALGLAGCVGSNAGVTEARSAAQTRFGLDARDTSDGDLDDARAELLKKPLTADSAARLAVLGSPRANAAFAAIGMARGKLASALRLPNPEVDGGIVFFPDETRVAVGGSIDVTELLLLPLRASAGEAGLDVASLEAAAEVADLALEARLAYFDYQAARRTLELEKSSAYAAAQTSELASRLDAAGNVPPLVALGERALYEESRMSLARAELAELTARERLNATMGVHGPDGAAWRAVDALPPPPERELEVTDLEKRAIEQSLDLEILRGVRGSASRAADSAAAAGLVPELRVGVEAERESDAWGVGPRIGLGVPLFYQGQGEVAAAESAMRVADARVEATAVQIRAAARALGARLSAARSAALFYRDTILPLRRRILEESLRSYNAMSIGAFQLFAAKRAEVEAERAAVDALREYWSVRAQVDALARGRLPKGALAMPAAASVAPSGAGDAGGH